MFWAPRVPQWKHIARNVGTHVESAFFDQITHFFVRDELVDGHFQADQSADQLALAEIHAQQPRDGYQYFAQYVLWKIKKTNVEHDNLTSYKSVRRLNNVRVCI